MTVLRRLLADNASNIIPLRDAKTEAQHKRTASKEIAHRRTPSSPLQHKRNRINSLTSCAGSPQLTSDSLSPPKDNIAAVIDSDRPPLNVIIPIGGIGSRFQKESFRFPKPLINIVGRPMLCWVMDRLSFCPQDTVWLAINEAVDEEYRVEEMVRKEFPKVDLRVLKLKYLTRGAAETLFIVTQSMSPAEKSRRTVSLDCDTIYFADILTRIRDLDQDHGACVYFKDTGHKAIFSYLQTETTGPEEIIVDIQEKKAISRNANTGAYVFPSAEVLQLWAMEALDAPASGGGIAGELYTSHLIANMIKSGNVVFEAIHIEEDGFSCVGTPVQLQNFLQRVKREPHLVAKKRRFCFDLDMTLVGAPTIEGRYDTCEPIQKNIELVRELKRAGHTIIIQTARRMKTHSGNLGAVIADIGVTTIKSLEKFNIPYDEIYFGKPYAHVYVDDLAVNANLDTYREIGWTIGDDGQDDNKLSDAKEATKAGIVASRSFNTIQILGDRIVKTSESSALLGEMFFYAHVPEDIEDLFPRCYSVELVGEERRNYSVIMEKLHGTTYSHLLVGRAMTVGRLRSFLNSLTAIHRSCSGARNPPEHLLIDAPLKNIFEEKSGDESIYANYSSKVSSRFCRFEDEYLALDPSARLTHDIIVNGLREYESTGRGIEARVIHGDPVFSNAILTNAGAARFVDVRCCLGDKLTMKGDILYDLAKVLQSLQGYDHVLLNNTHVQEQDKVLLSELQGEFWRYVEENYGDKVKKEDVTLITASLLFSLIPLHEMRVRPLFYEMCTNVLKFGNAWME